jgi:N-acylglucosamine-6-phosphate 2-epimerase
MNSSDAAAQPPASRDPVLALKGGVIVSVQADPASPLAEPAMIAALAQVVSQAGCVGLRIDSPAHIRAVRRHTALPIIGLYKQKLDPDNPFITPTFAAAVALAEAGAGIIALEATARRESLTEPLAGLLARIRTELALPVMADVSSFEEGVQAAELGAELVATTLAGYFPPPPVAQDAPPDLQLVQELARTIRRPVVAEGRFNTPELARQAIQAGAYAVVVGTAITDPGWIAAQFVKAVVG